MITELYAMAQNPGGAQGSGGLGSMLIPLLFMFGVFYFLLIRPQKKRETEHRKFLSGLKKGDEVILQSGLYGRVAGLTEQVVTLEVADHVRIRASRSSIAGMQPKAGEGNK